MKHKLLLLFAAILTSVNMMAVRIFVSTTEGSYWNGDIYAWIWTNSTDGRFFPTTKEDGYYVLQVDDYETFNIVFSNASSWTGTQTVNIENITQERPYRIYTIINGSYSNKHRDVKECSFSGKCGENLQYSYVLDTKTLTITGHGDMYKDAALIDYPHILRTVILPDSLTSIGEQAFYNCTGLTSVTIPNSVTSIEEYAFEGCTSLTSITIPNSVTSIGESAFDGCTSLTSITIPNSVTSIGDEAFSWCTRLTSVTIGNNVTSIGNSAFSGCSRLISVAWNAKSCTYSENNSPFADAAANITSFTFGNEVETIPAYLCKGMTKLTSVTIPNSATSIGSSAFSGCSRLISVAWNAKSCTYSGNNSPFVDAAAIITSFTFGNEVETIPAYLCKGMTKLTSVTIPNSATSIGSSAFSGCSRLISVAWNAKSCTYSGNNSPFVDAAAIITSFTFGNEVETIPAYLCKGMTKLTSVTIPNSVTSIGEQAFYNCTGLTNVTIPESVTNIGDAAFSKCVGLTSVAWNAKSCIYSENNSPFADAAAIITSFTFGNEVETIPAYLCKGMTKLTSVTIPNSATSIGGSTFYGCTGLTAITIPNKVTSIGGSAFSGCTNLKSVTIPNSVTSIGSSAFRYCRGLTSVTIPNSVTSIGKDVFLGCTNLISLIIPNSVADIPSGLLTQLYALDSISVPAAVFDVAKEYWHYQPKTLSYVELNRDEITDNVSAVLQRSYKTLRTLDVSQVSNTTIPDETFKGYYNLQTLCLPANLKDISYMAVADCKSLLSITIPATVEEIGSSAFENCRSLKSVIFGETTTPQSIVQHAPASVTFPLHRIGNWAFYNCHELQNLIIPKGVKEIGDAAFYGCTYLNDITLPSSVETIGDNTFALCSKLQKITVQATTPPVIQAKTFYEVNRAIPVYVPTKAVATYKNDEYWKEFNIQGEITTAFDNISSYDIDTASLSVPQKILINGQVYIFRNGKTYTLTGIEIK